jgi:uncharacterized protein YigA (DUF484 family)
MGIQGITEHDIANYLANTPTFFERHAELLSSIQLSSPHGQRAVSLQERQMEMLRDKIKGLEQKIMEMIRHGQENVSIADRLHRFTRTIMLTGNVADLPGVVVRQVMQQFMIPQAGIRMWEAAPAFAELDFARAVSDDVKSFASSLNAPYCGANASFEAAQWLEEPQAVASIALIPLHQPGSSRAFGMLVLGSPDPTRYAADMGTEFLARVGEIVSAGLSRLLSPAA